MDFTTKTYRQLLDALISRKYIFQTFAEFLKAPAERAVILRHDVEAKYQNSLVFAKIQREKNIYGSYYFRFLPDHFNKKIIVKIAELGHEIGYHYEDLTYFKGDFSLAIERFEQNLQVLNQIAPVKTISMEGAPLSKYDNRDLWKKYDYHNYGIIGEPYFDLDFSKVLYLTDTGRRWNGDKVSIRDKVPSNFDFSFKHTKDIIENIDKLPDKIMLTFHPQRWNDSLVLWVKELIWQNVKNQGKRLLVVVRSRN